MNCGRQAALFVSSGFYLGRLPIAPGTFGSLPGLGLWFLLSKFEWVTTAVVMVLFTLFAVWVAGLSANALNCKDPSSVVIDEVAGMAVALIGIPFSWTACVLGFILFRLLDIVKPFPIDWVDEHVGGGIGIVLDDILAGLIANITLRILFQLIDIIF